LSPGAIPIDHATATASGQLLVLATVLGILLIGAGSAAISPRAASPSPKRTHRTLLRTIYSAPLAAAAVTTVRGMSGDDSPCAA